MADRVEQAQAEAESADAPSDTTAAPNDSGGNPGGDDANPDGASARPDGSGGATPADAAAEARRKLDEKSLLEQMGGVTGMVYSAIPVIVFVVANSIGNLTIGIWSALASAAIITVVRVVRKETVQPAVSGFFGVGIAAFIAYRTGEARGFFLWGIWVSLVYGGVFVASVLVRWPLVGVAWNLLNGSGMAWRKDKPSLRAYDIATLACAVVFFARYTVQQWLYAENLTGWLAFTKIAMGLPLFGLALIVVIWAIRRSDRRLKALVAERVETEAEIEQRLREKYS